MGILKGPLTGLGDWTNIGGTVGKSSAVRGLLGRASGSKYMRGAALGVGGVGVGKMMMNHMSRKNGRYPVR